VRKGRWRRRRRVAEEIGHGTNNLPSANVLKRMIKRRENNLFIRASNKT
jgi:hypothetical protein